VISNWLHDLMKSIFPFPLFPLCLLVGMFYVNFVCRIAIAPLLPVIKENLGLGLTKAGSLFLMMATGYCLGLFLSGFVTARLSHRRTILISAGLMGVAMITLSQTVSMTGMYFSLIIAGLSSGFYLPSGIAILTELVSREHWGRAIAVHEVAPNLGFVSAPLLAEALLRLMRWRSTLALMGVWSIVMGLVFLFFGPGGNHRGEAPQFSSMRRILTQPPFWVMAAFFSVSIGASFGIYGMTPLFLVKERGMPREWANTLVGLSRATAFLTLLFSGWLTDRAGHRRAMILFLTATGLSILLIGIIQNPGITPLFIVLQASSSAGTFPAGFAMLSALFPLPFRNLAVSLVILIGSLLGGGAFPLGIGYIAEKYSFSWSFSILGLLALSMVPFLFLDRSGERPNP